MPFHLANAMPAAANAIQPISRATRKPAGSFAIGLILASGLFATAGFAESEDPPANLAKLVAERESATAARRNEYMYRQTVTLDELDQNGAPRGQYKEVREVIFSPAKERSEQLVGKPLKNLKYLVLTDEDFHDIGEIQSMVLTADRLWNYETKFRGEETMDGVDCWVLQVRPR